nr:mechanosensitive ion channel family protein [Desulfobulbaceae bacterium]
MVTIPQQLLELTALLTTIFNENIWLKRFLIILIYIVLAKAVDFFINKVLRYFVSKSKTELDDSLIEIFHNPVYWSVFFVGAFHALHLQPVPAPWQYILVSLFQSMILLVWAIAGLKALNIFFNRTTIEYILRRPLDNDAFNIGRKLIRIVAIIGIIVGILVVWDINLTPLFASAGIAGIAVAMAAKDSLANFFGGMSLFMDKTFKEGDYIVLDSGERGEIMDIGMRSTRLKTRDDVLITIPNSILANTKIINESAPVPLFRIRIPIGVAYGTDPDRVEQLLCSIATASSDVIEDPPPRARFRALGNSSIDFELLCWVAEPSLKGLITHNLLKEIYNKLYEEKITIPFPQQDVHLYKH